MNLDDLTIGEARKLASMFGCIGTSDEKHAAIGKYVIVRTYSAGVHAGVLASAKGTEVELTESRRIWSWSGALSCSEISQAGIAGGKVAIAVPSQFLTEAIEIIPASTKAEKCLRAI